MDNQPHTQTQNNLTEDDWKIVEARLQYDIDNNIGMDMSFGVLNNGKQKN
jgi:hypothetical protein